MNEAAARSRSSRGYLLIILAIAIPLSAYLYWSHRRAQDREDLAYAEEQRRLQATVAEMTNRWNANSNWRDGLKGSLPSDIYTSDVEKAVLGERPVLFYARLDDISTTNDGYRAKLSSLATDWLVHMRYYLTCDSTAAKKLLGEKHGPLEIFAVVAHINHVEKRTEPDTSYFAAEGDVKYATFVGVSGISLANSRKN
jgi:hypothetical protein